MNNIRVWCAVVVCVIGTVAYGGDIVVEGDLTVQSNLVVQQDVAISNNLSCTGSVTADSFINANNTATGVCSLALAGEGNSVDGYYNSIVGGLDNIIVAQHTGFIGGGGYNVITNGGHEYTYSCIVGGQYNYANSGYTFIGGGQYNRAEYSYAAIAGGQYNRASASYSFVGGGARNDVTNQNAVISGGADNFAGGAQSFIGGGFSNQARDIYAIVVGGERNIVDGNYGVILGGYSNYVSGDYAMAAGYRAEALHDGAFVWSDSQTNAFQSVTNDEFAVSAQGGVRFVTEAGKAVSIQDGVVTAEGFNGDGSGITNLPASASDAFVKKAGDTMSGDLNMGDNRIRNVSTNGITINGFDGEYTMWREDTSLEALRSDYGSVVLGSSIEINGNISFSGHPVIGIEESVLYNYNASWVMSWSDPESPLAVNQNLSVTGEVTAAKFTGDGSGITNLPATASDAFVKKAGDTMSGDLNMGDNRIRNVSTNGITINGFDGEYTMWREDTSLEALRSDYNAIAFGDLEIGIGGAISFAGHNVIGIEEHVLCDLNGVLVMSWGDPDRPLEIRQNLSVTGEVTAAKFTGDGSGLTNLSVVTEETDPIFTNSVAGAITTNNVSNWDTAYGWGDHGAAGYLTNYSESDPVWSAVSNTVLQVGAAGTSTNLSEYVNDAGFLTDYTEEDPLYTNSAAYEITTNDVSNWAIAYSWGDHGTNGYLTEYNETDPTALKKDGSVAMTGDLDMGGYSITNVATNTIVYSDGKSVRQTYVDAAGDTMTGPLDMGTNVVISTAQPAEDSHVITMAFLKQAMTNMPPLGDLAMGSFTNGAPEDGFPIEF